MIRILKQKQKIITKFNFGISTKQVAKNLQKEQMKQEKDYEEYLEKLKNFNQDALKEVETNYGIDAQEIKLIQRDMLESRFGFIFDRFLDDQTFENLTVAKKQQRLEQKQQILNKMELLKDKLNYSTVEEELKLHIELVKQEIPEDFEEENIRDQQKINMQLKQIDYQLKEEGLQDHEKGWIKDDLKSDFVEQEQQQENLYEKEENLQEKEENLQEKEENLQEKEVQQENTLEIAEIDEILNPDEDQRLALKKKLTEFIENKTGKTIDEVLELLEKKAKLKKSDVNQQDGEEEQNDEGENKQEQKIQHREEMENELEYVNIRDIEELDYSDPKNELNLSMFMQFDKDNSIFYSPSGIKKALIEINKARCQPFQKADDFRKFINQKEFLSIVIINRIYLHDNNYITNQQISNLMSCYDKDKCYNQTLDLIKYHYQFVNTEQKTQLFQGVSQCNQFLAKYSKSKDFNYLSFSFHLIRLCKQNIMEKVDQDDLLNQFLRITIDSDKKFYEMHKDLLLNKYLVQKNDALRYFLFDTFYSAKHYEIGILQYLITIQILARVQLEKPCQDLLKLAQKTFGNKFDNLFNSILPCILRQLPNRNIYDAYMNKNQRNQTYRITYFDQQILKKISNVTTIYDQNVDEDYQKSQHFQIKFQDYNNYNQLLYFRKSEPQYKYGSRLHYQNMMLNNDYSELFFLINECLKSKECTPFYNQEDKDPKKALQYLHDKFDDHLGIIEETGTHIDDYFLQLNNHEELYNNPNPELLPQYDPLEDKANVQSTIVESDILIPEVKMIKKGFSDKNLDNMVKNQIDSLNKKKNNLFNKSYTNFCTDNKSNDDDKFKQFLQKQKEIDINTKLSLNEVEQLKEQLQIKSQVQQTKIEVNEVDNILKNVNDFQEQQQTIMKQLETLTLQNSSSEQIQRFIQQMIKNYNELLIHMFFDQESAFSKYPLPFQAYTQLLNNLKSNYTRNGFRHVMSHFIKANKELKKEKIQLVIQMSNLLIDKNQRTVYFELVRQDEVINDEQIIIYLVGGLTKFPDTRNEIADLIKRYLNVDENAKFKIDLIKEFIEAQKQKNNYQEIMILFEQIKDNIQSKKPKFDKQTPSDQIMVIQRQFKESMIKQMHLFYQDIIQFLNANKKTKEAQILFQDMMNQKYEIEERDFINGFQCNQDNAVMTVKIFTAVETYKKEMINKNFFKIISTNIIANSLYMHDLFEKIVKDYILTDKNLDQEIIEITLKMFEALPIGSLFSDFLKVIIAQYIILSERQKIQCYNVLQTCQDNNSKSFIKGLISQIYDQDRIKQINKYKGRQDGQEILNSMFQEKVEREIVEFDGWNDLMKVYAKPISAIMARGKNKRKRTSYQAKTYLEFISFDEELDCKQLREKHK